MVPRIGVRCGRQSKGAVSLAAGRRWNPQPGRARYAASIEGRLAAAMA